MLVVVLQIEIGIFLAAHTCARRVGPNIANLAPVRDRQPLSIFVHEHRPRVYGIDLKMARRIEVPHYLKVCSPKPLVVQDPHRRLVAFQIYLFVVAHLERGLIAGRPDQRPAQRKTRYTGPTLGYQAQQSGRHLKEPSSHYLYSKSKAARAPTQNCPKQDEHETGLGSKAR